jgi:glycosyltransferase involved in cell wall biosynthesis
MMPKVTVIIPTYNRAGLLPKAIESVLMQTYRDIELIVIDGGSIDNTREIVANYYPAVRYFYQEKGGFSASRNNGIDLARGEYISFLDDDDVLLEHALQREVEILDEHLDVGYIYGQAYFVDTTGRIIGLRKSAIFADSCVVDGKEQIREMLFTYRIGMSGVMVRLKCFKEGNKFDERLKYIAEDFLLFLQLAKKYKVAYIAEPLVKRLLHPGNQFRNPNPRQAELAYLLILKELFDDPISKEYSENIKRKAQFCFYRRIVGHAYGKDMGMTRRYLRKAFMAYPQSLVRREGITGFSVYLKSFIPDSGRKAVQGFKHRIFSSRAAQA